MPPLVHGACPVSPACNSRKIRHLAAPGTPSVGISAPLCDTPAGKVRHAGFFRGYPVPRGFNHAFPAMTFDFDTVIDRRGTDSQKWQRYAGRDILPLWVADMDFKSSPAIIAALQARVAQGIFGYARPVKSTVDAFVQAAGQRYGWTVDPAWLVWLPGLVVGLNLAARAFAQPGEEVLTLSPVYPPFMSAPKNSGRVSVQVSFHHDAAARRWEIDWDALERAVTPKTKIFFLCNPHNPLARVWRREELVRLGEFCARHDLLICSDEIHCDLILDALPHVPTALLGEQIARRTITFMAPSKTYNVPGLGTSIAIIPDGKLRTQFVRTAAGVMAEVTGLGFAACEAAYRDSEPWRQALVAYLRGNRDFLVDFVARELPGVAIEAPIEATYLAWLNVSALKLADPHAHFEKHGVGLSDGAAFGEPRGLHVRINFGCPRATLAEALARMKRALAAI